MVLEKCSALSGLLGASNSSPQGVPRAALLQPVPGFWVCQIPLPRALPWAALLQPVPGFWVRQIPLPRALPWAALLQAVPGFWVRQIPLPRALPWAALLQPVPGEESVFRRPPQQDEKHPLVDSFEFGAGTNRMTQKRPQANDPQDERDASQRCW